MSFDYDLNFAGCKATTHNLSNGPVDEFAIVVYDRQDGSDSRIDFDANPAHYTREEVAIHQQRFIALLHQLVSRVLPLRAYNLLLPDELNTVICNFNATAHPVAEATLPQLVESQVARTPDLASIVFGECSSTYAELNACANRLAHCLAAMNIGPEALVGICLPRSPEMIIALLAVLKTGAAYLPLDPEYPQARSCKHAGRCHACLHTHDIGAFFTSAAGRENICARFCRGKPGSESCIRSQPQRCRTALSASASASCLCHLYVGFHR